jgi:Bromodomain/Cytosine specific DNA methyltransferase replication foci domain
MPPGSSSRFVGEADVPGSYDMGKDDEGVPQRDLTDFVLTRGSEMVSLCALDNEKTHGVIRARGKLCDPHGGSRLVAVTDNLVEWCIEYGAAPKLWIRSANVWYNLKHPSSEYEKVHDLALRRFEICARLYLLVTDFKAVAPTFKSYVHALSGPWEQMRGYTEKEILGERDFILNQVKELDEQVLNDCPFYRELREKKTKQPARLGPVPGQPPTKKKKKSSASPSTSAVIAATTPSLPHNADRPADVSGISGPVVPSSPKAKPVEFWSPRGEPALDAFGQDRLMKRMDKVLMSVMKNKTALPFLSPVTPDQCPDYADRIRTPMDYGTIRERLTSGNHYTSALQIAEDVRLIAKNCLEYNGDHAFSTNAVELGRKFENQLRAAEDAESKAMQKRLAAPAPNFGKKRRASTGADADGGAPTSSKPPRNSKLAKAAAIAAAAAISSQVDGDEQVCCSTAGSSPCDKPVRPNSRYCSDECAMAVARKKIEFLIKENVNVDDYIRGCIGKQLVASNPLNR